jgi:hypothetical protein
MTLNPARALGIDDRTGSLAPGRWPDVVVWAPSPASTRRPRRSSSTERSSTIGTIPPTSRVRFRLGTFEAGGPMIQAARLRDGAVAVLAAASPAAAETSAIVGATIYARPGGQGRSAERDHARREDRRRGSGAAGPPERASTAAERSSHPACSIRRAASASRKSRASRRRAMTRRRARTSPRRWTWAPRSILARC